MHILLTNDDGIWAPGLKALKNELKKIAAVSVVAPMHEKSGVGHSVTFNLPLLVQKQKISGRLFGYAVDGTPADCVKIAVKKLIPEKIDLIVAGLNLGANLGINVLYSGTVAAAIEGSLLGIPSLAISLEASENPDFKRAARIFRRILKETFLKNKINFSLMNINIPCKERGEIKGVRITTQSFKGFVENYVERVDPRGRTYYWLSGADDKKETNESFDTVAIEQGYVSITPLFYDFTDKTSVKRLKKLNWNINLNK